MSVFYNQPGIVEAEVNPALNCIVVHWENLDNGKIVQECCLAQLEEVKKGVKTIIVDTATADGLVPFEVQEWFGTTLFPQLRDAGLKAIITVIPRSAITRLASKRWTNTGKPFNFDMFDAESLDAAMNLAAKYAG